MQIHFCCHLYYDAVDGEVRAVDEFGVGFGGVVGGSVFRPHLIVNGFLGLLDMQFARVAVCILSSEVIDAVGDVGGLLDLDEEVSSSDGMQPSGRQEEEVSLVCFVGSDDILHGRMTVDRISCCKPLVVFGRDGGL